MQLDQKICVGIYWPTCLLPLIDQHICELLNYIEKYGRGIFDKLHPSYTQAQMTVNRETRLIQKLDMSQLNSLVSKTV